MVVLVHRCNPRRTASGGSAGMSVPGATQRCGKCPRWCPGGRGRSATGRWSPGGRRGLECRLGGLLRACPTPKVPILAPDRHHPAREVPLMGSRWPVDGRTPTDGPQVAVRAFERHPGLLRAFGDCPARESTGWCRSPATRVVGSRSTGEQGGGKGLTWWFSAVDPESGTIDLAPTAVWVNDR